MLFLVNKWKMYVIDCNVKLVKSKCERYLKLLSHPTYKHKRTIFNENLVAVHMNKKEIKLDKPIINGFIILELSKYLMYDFYYNVLQKRYGDKIKLLFTDTDSLCVEIETEDVYKDMQDDKQYYIFQNILKITFYTVKKIGRSLVNLKMSLQEK